MNTRQLYFEDSINKESIVSLANNKLKSLMSKNGLQAKLTPRNKSIVSLQDDERSSEIFIEDYEEFDDIAIFLKSKKITPRHYS